jgi:hypothetical protein
MPLRWINGLAGRLHHPVPCAPTFDIGIYAVFDAELLETGDRRAFVDNFISAISHPAEVKFETIPTLAPRSAEGIE